MQQASRYLCKGAPVDPPDGRWRSALRLAVITDRQRTVSLLLASGASLSASLLQEAWHSPDVTPHVHAALITVSTFVCLCHNNLLSALTASVTAESTDEADLLFQYP